MKTIMRVLFVTAMALTIVYSAGAGISFAIDKADSAAPSVTAYSDFVNGFPTDNGNHTPDVMGSLQ